MFFFGGVILSDMERKEKGFKLSIMLYSKKSYLFTFYRLKFTFKTSKNNLTYVDNLKAEFVICIFRHRWNTFEQEKRNYMTVNW